MCRFLKSYFNSILLKSIAFLFLSAIILSCFLNKNLSVVYEFLFLAAIVLSILFYFSLLSFYIFRNIHLYENELKTFCYEEGIVIDSINFPDSNMGNPFIGTEEELPFIPILKIISIFKIKSATYRTGYIQDKASIVWIKIYFRFNEISKIKYLFPDD